jgi:prepilin-type N-terminal cleavage/methylation domain-containing protein
MQRWKRRRAVRGVTLVEILVVLGIMAMIAGAVAFGVLPAWERAQVKTTQQNAIALRGVAVGHRIQTTSVDCPTIDSLHASQALDRASRTTDAWDQPYRIVCAEDGEITVVSPGPDRKMGTQDDIAAPPPPKAVASE